jgi:3-phenylpropionate/trans-cinnamate dioxygenase ferredoxin reductase component
MAASAGATVEGADTAGEPRRLSAPPSLPLSIANHGYELRHLAVEHWQDAADQGAIAGAGAAGRSAKWDAVPGFWTTIGHSTLKYHAWGDGYQHSRLLDRKNGFTVWYEADGAAVGVLTCNGDEDYDLGENLITQGKPAPAQVTPPRRPPRPR